MLASVVGGRKHDPDYDMEDLPSSSGSHESQQKGGHVSSQEAFAGIKVTTLVQQSEDKAGRGDLDDSGSTKGLVRKGSF